MEVVLRCATRRIPLIAVSDRDGNAAAAPDVRPVSTQRSNGGHRIANGAGGTRRKGDSPVGQVLRGDCGRGVRGLGPLRRRDVGYGEVWRPFPDGHLPDQHHWCLPDRNPHDPLDGTFSAPPQLATFPGGGRARRIYDVFKLRIRDLSGRSNGRALVGFGLHGKQRNTRIPGCLDGRATGRPAIAVYADITRAREVKC